MASHHLLTISVYMLEAEVDSHRLILQQQTTPFVNVLYMYMNIGTIFLFFLSPIIEG